MPNRLRWVMLAGLTGLMVAGVVVSWNTRDAMDSIPLFVKSSGPGRPRAAETVAVNLQPWKTAEGLAALTSSAAEAQVAREAQHLADHVVDQAFAAALRETTMQKLLLSAEGAALAAKVAGLQKTVAADEARVRELTASDPDDDLDVAKAQLALDNDQYTEAQRDLTRAGGDPRARIQEELATHEVAMQRYDAQESKPQAVAMRQAQAHSTTAADMVAWFRERDRAGLVGAAGREARVEATRLTARHNQLELVPAGAAAGDKATRLAALNAQATRSQLLGIYDDQIETLGQLSQAYNKWGAQLAAQHRMTGRVVLRSVALIAFILICVLVLDEFAAVYARRPGLDKRRMETLLAIEKLTIRLGGAMLSLLVMFGRPSQLPTILGLATAGLTVALQDFIIAFFGWFVLMGKNGIRIGDWVEINGVAGEVVSIGVFRTAMLETGNDNNKGRPTGRRTAFINSFAIKGQYFNFSTTGQWMWDEIRVSIPAGQDVQKTIEKVRAQVMAETAKDAQQAEQEWKRVSRHFVAEPAVDVRPGTSGIDMVVRYVTRAGNRFAVRNRLYQEVLEMLRAGRE